MASGKGINTAKALVRLGHEVTLLQILAGENGKRCQEDCVKWGIRTLNVWVEGETRCCTTLLDSDGMATELIAPFRIWETDLEPRLLEVLKNNSTYDALLFCGSQPEGLPENLFRSLLDAVAANLVVWDSAVPWPADRVTRIRWIKVNEAERVALKNAITWLDPKSTGWDSGEIFPSLFITAGSNPAFVSKPSSAQGYYPVPWITGIRNPIGAGDAVTAGLTDSILRGSLPEEAVAWALAIGTASCLSPLPTEWDLEKAETFKTEIRRRP